MAYLFAFHCWTVCCAAEEQCQSAECTGQVDTIDTATDNTAPLVCTTKGLCNPFWFVYSIIADIGITYFEHSNSLSKRSANIDFSHMLNEVYRLWAHVWYKCKASSNIQCCIWMISLMMAEHRPQRKGSNTVNK
jgi:hypothetical protein